MNQIGEEKGFVLFSCIPFFGHCAAHRLLRNPFSILSERKKPSQHCIACQAHSRSGSLALRTNVPRRALPWLSKERAESERERAFDCRVPFAIANFPCRGKQFVSYPSYLAQCRRISTSSGLFVSHQNTEKGKTIEFFAFIHEYIYIRR